MLTIMSNCHQEAGVLLVALTNEFPSKNIAFCELFHRAESKRKELEIYDQQYRKETVVLPEGRWELYGSLAEYRSENKLSDIELTMLEQLQVPDSRCIVLQIMQ